jgi:hypothetical protein
MSQMISYAQETIQPDDAETGARPAGILPPYAFQRRVANWTRACFGDEIAKDRIERSDRALEEMLELYQAVGNEEARAIEIARYVFSRPAGEIAQELGSAALTLASLADACDENLAECAEAELVRATANIAKIRAKRAAQQDGSPLPGFADPAPHRSCERSFPTTQDGQMPAGLAPVSAADTALVSGSSLLLYKGEGISVPIGIELRHLEALLAAAQTLSPLLDLVSAIQQNPAQPNKADDPALSAQRPAAGAAELALVRLAVEFAKN